MPDTAEFAQEHIERAHEGHEHAGDSLARRTAVLIAMLAAVLAIVETSEKAAQSEYIAHHVSLSNDFAFYQAKTVRYTSYGLAADLLDSLPNAGDPAIRERAEAARRNVARMDDDPKTGEGRKQLMERAKHQEELRDHAAHRYHLLEYATGALQIAIVLASVSVVTRVLTLAFIGGGLGALAGLFALLVGMGAF